ncbi:MAG TPA: CDC48 family AAA ATPase [Candidatus Nitrosocosmicus sp.]|nr:CDC48 family AAA ATPase [Candidatus Nitrosocosmicus sp.]
MKNTREVYLKVAETDIKFVGKGLALVDPEIVGELQLKVGDVLKLRGKKGPTYVKLSEGLSSDYGRKIIRVDGYTRGILECGIDDHIMVSPFGIVNVAKEVELIPSEELEYSGFKNSLAALLDGRVISRSDIVPINLVGKRIVFLVNFLNPNFDPLLVKPTTKFSIGSYKKSRSYALEKINYEDIGGIKDSILKIREMIELPIRHPELFEKLGIDAPKGVLLYGPPGTGKTLLAKAVANETNASFFTISGPEIMSKFYGESEKRLRDTFEQAQERSPSILFIDELDSIAPKREGVSGEVERRIVSQLLTLMDGINSRGKIIVIGASNRPNAIDSALRRPGRFDREIEIGIPDDAGRLDILNIHTKGMPLGPDVDLERLSRLTHGFVGADLEVLTKEAAMRSLRRLIPQVNIDQTPIPQDLLDKITIIESDFNNALKDVTPSASREFSIQRPTVKWSEVGGLDSIKEELVDLMDWLLNHSEIYEIADIRPPKGLLLYGPPGTGKTLLAKAVASNSNANFISIKGSELLSKWAGESEKAIQEVFRKARQLAPCIIFFDEFDAIALQRTTDGEEINSTDKIMSQILTEMDGIENLDNVIVIGATNRIDLIDKALLRPGRFDRIIEIPIPTVESRRQIIKIHLKKKPFDEKTVTIDRILKLTNGFTGAQIEGMINYASILALRDFLRNHRKSEANNPEYRKLKKLDLKNFRITFEYFKLAKENIVTSTKDHNYVH